MTNPQDTLPPGFRFYPTDEELILHYLKNKVTSIPLPVSIIAEVDIYKFDPWDLPGKAKFGEKEWYFFSPRDRKYPNGARPNRAAASGYWKATGTDKTIVATSSSGGLMNIGVKKALVFYEGRPPRGIKTNWIMHEYRLADALRNNYGKPSKLKISSMRLDDWVLCRIYKKHNGSAPAIVLSSDHDQEGEEPSMIQASNSHDHQATNRNCTAALLQPQRSSSFSNLVDALDYSMLSSFLNDTNQSTIGFDPLFTNSTNSYINDQIMYNSPIYCTNEFNRSNTSLENRLKRRNL